MKKVLLYSGGMDSLICARLLKPDVCLYVDTGSQYSEKEQLNLEYPSHGRLTSVRLQDLGRFERKNDLILPMRNAFLCLMAANYGEEIILGATYGDRSTDKDSTFACLMTNLLAHMWQPQHWIPEGKQIVVTLPFKNVTKAKMVTMYLSDGGEVRPLRDSISCYHSSVIHCGACKPCARKWVALQLNGIEHPEYRTDPARYFTPEMIEKMQVGKYRGPAEDHEILLALKGRGLV